MRQQQGCIYGTLLEDEGAAACSYNAKKHTHTQMLQCYNYTSQ